MAIKITKATELEGNKNTFLIYSSPGMGKTTAIKYLPGRKIVVDIDKSSSVLKGVEDIDVLEVDTYNIWDQWMETITFLQKNKDDYDFIVIDNITELFRSVLTQLGREGKNNRVPGMDAYQRADFVLVDSFRALKGLEKNLVFTAWEMSDQWHTPDGQMYNRAMPELRKPISNNLMGLCDVVARLVVHTDDEGIEKRGFVLQPSNNVYAKNRLSDAKGAKVEELFAKTVGIEEEREE